MFKINVTKKLLGLIAGVILILTSASIYVVYSVVTHELDISAQNEINNDSKIMDIRFADFKNNLLSLAKAQSIRPNVVNGIKENNTLLLHKIAQDLINSKNSEQVIFAQANGTVVARGENDKSGDDISYNFFFKQAMANLPTTGVDETNSKVFLRASYPVSENNKIIGVVILSINIFDDHSFVDTVKQMVKAECTVFLKEMRISTTIIRDGNRAIGTRMDNEKVIQTVLREAKSYNSVNTILGESYTTAYWPFKDVQNNVIGMFFIGKSRKDIANSQNHILKTILTWQIIVGLVLILIAFFIGKFFVKPIINATAFAKKVSEGDLSQKLLIKQKDEIGQLGNALNLMVDNLKTKIKEAEEQSIQAQQEAENAQKATKIAENACKQAEAAQKQGELEAARKLEHIVERITDSTNDLSSRVNEISKGIAFQAQRIEETATATEQMNATVVEVAKNASNAAENAQQAKDKAMEGEKIVSNSIKAIQDVFEVAKQAKGNMEELDKMATAIGGIINVINDIADQTNLLALNAAIEAARAGEAGRGFAVVADEVRKLAEKTQNATKEVSESIKGIQKSAKDNFHQMEKASLAIENAIQMAQKSGDALNDIVLYANSNSDQVRNIATASEEQSAASEQISRSIDEINRIAADTSESMKQSTNAIEQVAKMAEELTNLISKLKN